MAQLLIRDIADTAHEAIKQAAAASGQSVEGWARSVLLAAAEAPIVRRRYGYRATGPGAARATILRHGDGAGAIGGGGTNLSEAQAAAYQRAKALIQRNEQGDQAAAVALLQAEFEIVVEAAI